jgi:hypothetical protein
MSDDPQDKIGKIAILAIVIAILLVMVGALGAVTSNMNGGYSSIQNIVSGPTVYDNNTLYNNNTIYHNQTQTLYQNNSVIPASYNIEKLGTYTVAINTTTNSQQFNSTNSKVTIQNAINATKGSIFINAGTYNIGSIIYTDYTSIYGAGNSTILVATSNMAKGLINIGGRTVHPNAIIISNLQINGNHYAIEGIGLDYATYCTVQNCYIHDVKNGQGVYEAASWYCTVNNCWIYNIGQIELANYGTGVAWGTQEPSLSQFDSITYCQFQNCSMSDIDLEPAGNITIDHCTFTHAAQWTPAGSAVWNSVITILTVVAFGSHQTDNNIITNNYMYGGFNNFIVTNAITGLATSNGTLIQNNKVIYTASATAIYIMNSKYVNVFGNTIDIKSANGIVFVNGNYCNIDNNIVLDLNAPTGDYGIRCYASGGISTHNNAIGNEVINFGSGISINSGSDYTIITSNQLITCPVATRCTGTNIVTSGNLLGGGTQLTY